MKYVRLFETTPEYESYMQGGGEVILPNVSMAKDAPTTMYFNPIPPMNIITYKASAKLTETTDTSYVSGLHINSFSGKSGQLIMTSHTFENGVGTIEFDGDVISIGNYAFRSCTDLTSVTIPNSITSIGNGVFYGCSGLTSITIPDNVTSIGTSAFSGCSGLISITIPDSVTSIGDSTFANCSGLTSITIPDSVTSIDYMAFINCTGLISITIGSSVTSIDTYAFCRCSGLTSIMSLATTAPSIKNNTFQDVKRSGKLYVPMGSTNYNVWMYGTDYYLGKYNWTKVEQ